MNDDINILDIKDKLEKNNSQELLEYLEIVKDKWLPSGDDSILNWVSLGLGNMKLDEGDLTMSSLDIQYKKNVYEIIYLHLMFVKNDMISEGNDDTDYTNTFNKIFEILYYIERFFRSAIRLKITSESDYNSTMNNDIGLFRFKTMDVESQTSYQKLVLYLLSLIYERGYRRYNGYIYDKIYNENEKYTYSWKSLMDIKDFIYENTKKEITYEQWNNLTSDKSNIKYTTEHLNNCIDPQFPDLVKNRKVFSFRNGVYIIKKKYEMDDYFYTYGDAPELPPSVVAVKYFDMDFEPEFMETYWYDIPTPNIQKILDYQYKDEDDYIKICKWAYILIGRVLYHIGELDDWQVIPYFIGQAGTGKSTILTEIVNHFYEKCDVGVLSNNIENVFGLAALKDKCVIIAPELKHDLRLSQTDFQSIISGEDISIAIKHKSAETIKWNTPLICSGNEAPGFVDNSGSISRRLVLFYMNKKVKDKDSDPLMKQKLQLEIARILLKCNKAYLEAISKYGEKNIWNNLPKYFKSTKEQIQEDTNVLYNYFSSGSVKFSSELFVPESIIKQELNNHCINNNLKKPKITQNFYDGPFTVWSEKTGVDIKIEMGKKVYQGIRKNCKWIIGLDVVNDEEDQDELE